MAVQTQSPGKAAAFTGPTMGSRSCAVQRTPAQAWQESLDADTATPPRWLSVTLHAADGRTVRVPGAGFASTLPVCGT